jgi:hypothetical protein
MSVASLKPFSDVPTPQFPSEARRTAGVLHRTPYDRGRDLPRLIPLWPSEIADETPAGCTRLIQKLRRALREERRRGVAGHWTYDLARHFALHCAYRHELARLGRAAAVLASTIGR